ncbi:MAG: PAS domain S-box protein [Desulfobacterales bacterium]
MKPERRKRFSIQLMLAIGILVTVTVLLISGVLYVYFEKRLDLEFRNKIAAHKGQAELILSRRFVQIKRKLQDLSTDNAIRVTLLLDSPVQLRDRLARFYAPDNGLSFFVRKTAAPLVSPTHSEQFVDALFNTPPGELPAPESETSSLVWWFETPITSSEARLGTAYVRYDLGGDQEVIERLQQMVVGDILVRTTDGLTSLIRGGAFELDAEALAQTAEAKALPVGPENHQILKLDGYADLYFFFSSEDLISEKRRIALLIGLFTLAVLTFSAGLAIFLGQQMATPLRKMAQKAIHISRGEKDLSFETHPGDYWEIAELSKAFDSMLRTLKAAEEKSRYKELLENVDDAVYLVDRRSRILDANEASYGRLGYSPAEFFALPLSALMPGADAERVMGVLNAAGGRRTVETRHLKADGSFLPVEIKARQIDYRGEKVVLSVARDVSDRKEAEMALRESEERFRSVVENSHEGFVIIGDAFRIVYANPEACRVMGYPVEDMTGADIGRLLTPESLQVVKKNYFDRLRGDSVPTHYEFDVVRKDGDTRRVSISATMINDLHGNQQVVAQVLDITDRIRQEAERRELEDKLIHAQKMEAVGTLAGGIAHDFNNLLMGIQGRISVMQLNLPGDHPHSEHIQAIGKTIKSAAALTKQLLGFARGGKYEVKPTCLNDLVEKTCDMFSRTKKEVSIRRNLRGGLWSADVDQGQIEQVLLNLYVNAGQAMPDGGELFLETENVTLRAAFCRSYGVEPGEYVKVTVRDTGVGMDEETMARIFEPFFTTKEIGKGSGLGLASVYGIIQNHKGIVRVSSREGQGASFSIYLPASDKRVVAEAGVRYELARGEESILLVDDEQEILHVGTLMLKELGYHVVPACSGKDALAILEIDPQGVDLVILDMVMPEMAGGVAFDRLRAVRPDLRVLLASGYSLNRQTQEVIRRGGSGFIQKPFDMVGLSRKIREILDA